LSHILVGVNQITYAYPILLY